MELLEERLVPEHARAVKTEAREFAAEQIAPNAAAYYDSGKFPAELIEAGRDAGLVAPDLDPEYGADGDLTVEGDHACLAVVEVTQDCNLSCSYCFAGSGPGGKQRAFEDIVALLEVVKDEAGTRPIQFSGGEPTVRDDLPDLVEHAAEMGFNHVQVNTNGIRLANEDGYARRLAEAGVTALYLQFDGLTADTYEALREVDLVDEKHAAIEACRAADLPVVLVPTVVPGVNDDELGDIVRFGLDNADVVESINLQPVAQFGRFDDHGNAERFPLDEVARRLAAQLEGFDARDMLPVPCCSSYCQMATALLPRADGPVALTSFLDDLGDIPTAGPGGPLDLLAMRDELQSTVDYEGLLPALGEQGQQALAGIEELESAVEDGDVGYVSLVATVEG